MNSAFQDDHTLCSMWLQRVRQFGDSPAFYEKKGDRFSPISYKKFYEAVRSIALYLLEAGLKRGDHLAILSENRPEWAYVDMACLALGIVDVPVYPTLTPLEVAEILEHSKSRWVVVSSMQQFEKLITVRNRLPLVEKVIMMNPIGSEHGEHWLMDLAILIEQGSKIPDADEKLQKEICKANPEDMASIIYTSGTTGFPKGVMLTHNNFVSNCGSITKAVHTDLTDRCLSFLPLSHVFERTVGLYHMIWQGIPIAYNRHFDEILPDMAEIKPTLVLAVPRFYEKMYAKIMESIHSGSFVKKIIFKWALHTGYKNAQRQKRGKDVPGLLNKSMGMADALVFGKLKKLLGGSLRFFVSGGAPLAKPIAEFFESAGITILEGYGITECSPVVSVNRLELNKLGTVGKALEGVEIKIADDGEILVKGPNVMKGYNKMEKETSQALKDGWFYTGDIGTLDTDGFLTITDRKKDIIITSGGKNIAPQKIENLLKLDRYINDAIVHGDKRKYLAALIVPNFETLEEVAKSRRISFKNRTELVQNHEIKKFYLSRIHHHCEKLATFEKVKDFYLLDKEFSTDDGEVTPTMKLRRKKIEKRYKNEIDSLYPKEDLPS